MKAWHLFFYVLSLSIILFTVSLVENTEYHARAQSASATAAALEVLRHQDKIRPINKIILKIKILPGIYITNCKKHNHYKIYDTRFVENDDDTSEIFGILIKYSPTILYFLTLFTSILLAILVISIILDKVPRLHSKLVI